MPAINLCGRKIFACRQAAGMSQAGLARRCQLAGWDASRDTIAKIEQVERMVTDYELATLAKVFRVRMEELIEWPDPDG